MSYANFKPTVWSKYIQHELPKFTVFKQDCDYKFEGEAGQGKRVKILNVGRPTVKKYKPGKPIDEPDRRCYNSGRSSETGSVYGEGETPGHKLKALQNFIRRN